MHVSYSQPGTSMTGLDGKADELVIPLASEEASITKREVVKGRARIHVVTDLADEKLQTELRQENIEIRHVPVNRYIGPGDLKPVTRTEGDVVIIPIIEEVAVIEKRLLLKEELHIHRHAISQPAEIPVTLRRQRAEVETLKEDGTSTSEATET